MAHYIAELMEAARTAPPESKGIAEDRCAAAILEMWDHRTGLSDGRIPMELGPITDVLNRLDPATPQPIYFPNSWLEMSREAANGSMAQPAQVWLRVAEQVDQAARAIILFALGKAAESETDRAKHWVKLAKAAGAGDAPDLQLIRRLIVITTHGDADNTAEIEELKDKLAKLAEFRKAADAIEAEWGAELSRLMERTTAALDRSDEAN